MACEGWLGMIEWTNSMTFLVKPETYRNSTPTASMRTPSLWAMTMMARRASASLWAKEAVGPLTMTSSCWLPNSFTLPPGTWRAVELGLTPKSIVFPISPMDLDVSCTHTVRCRQVMTDLRGNVCARRRGASGCVPRSRQSAPNRRGRC